MLKSRGRTKKVPVTGMEEWPQVVILRNDGAPCAVKAACTVRSGGKLGDNFKELPIAISRSSLFGDVLLHRMAETLLSG